MKNDAVDQKPLYKKYEVTRTDGKPFTGGFVIEEKDPQYPQLLAAISGVYVESRPDLSYSLRVEALRVRNLRNGSSPIPEEKP